MVELTLVEAIRDALLFEMERDPRVVVLGEDVAASGGVFRATQGLLEKFGPNRVVDTPLSESAIIGSSVGLALSGLVPVAEIQFMGFTLNAFNQIVEQLARIRYRSWGSLSAPCDDPNALWRRGSGARDAFRRFRDLLQPLSGTQAGGTVQSGGCPGITAGRDPGPGSGDVPGAFARLSPLQRRSTFR